MRRRRLGEFTVGGIVGILIIATVGWATSPAPYAPAQPIDFPHSDHVRDDGLSCELCHSGARRAAHAGMPPVDRCIGCHRVVRTDNPGVIALHRYWNAGKPIPWVRVFTLPRFVRFNHEAHALADVDCAHCHGDVADMDRTTRARPFTMGWCVECHRAARAPDDCLTCHY